MANWKNSPTSKVSTKIIEKGWPTWHHSEAVKSTFWFLSCSLGLGPFNVLLELPCSWTVMLEVLKSSLQEGFMCSLDLGLDLDPLFRSKGTSQHPASFKDPWPIQGSIYFYWILEPVPLKHCQRYWSQLGQLGHDLKNQWRNEVTGELDQHPTSKCLWRPTTLRGFHYFDDVTWHSYKTPKQPIFKRFDADCMIPLLSYGKSNIGCGALGGVILNSKYHNHCFEKTLERERNSQHHSFNARIVIPWSHEDVVISGHCQLRILFLGTTAPRRLTTAAVVWKTQPAPQSLRDFKGLQKCM